MTAPELMLRLGSWMLATACLTLVAYAVQRNLQTGSRSLDAVSYLVISIALTTGLVLACGLLGALQPPALTAAALAALGAALLVPGLRGGVLNLPAKIPEWRRRIGLEWGALPGWMRLFILGFAAVSVLRFGFLIWALPPFVWDSMTYHLTNVAHWTQAGRIELFETAILRIYTPANFEVLATWFTVFLHHDAFVEAAGLPAYALAVLAVYSMARSLGAGRPASVVGAVAYGSTPALLLAATGTKNDPHMAAYFLASMAAIVYLQRNRNRLPGRTTLNLLALLLLTLGIAAGTKAYLIHMLPGLLIAFAFTQPTGDRSGLGYLGKAVRNAISRLARSARAGLLGLAILSVFLAGYWNVRNWILTGNPFFPYGVAVQGATVIDQGERQAVLSFDRLNANLELLAQRFGDVAGPIAPDLPNTTGWGWFAYGIGLASLAWAMVRRRAFLPIAGAFAVAFIMMLLSIRPSPWNMRYLIWFPAISGVAFALWLDRLLAVGGWPPAAMAALAAVTSMLNLTMVLNYNLVEPASFDLMLERSIWSREAAVLKLNMPQEYEYALLEVPDDEILGYNVHADGFVYPLYQADFNQRLVYVPIEGDDGCEEIRRSASLRGAEYLFAARGHSPPAVIAALKSCADHGIVEQGIGVFHLENES